MQTIKLNIALNAYFGICIETPGLFARHMLEHAVDTVLEPIMELEGIGEISS